MAEKHVNLKTGTIQQMDLKTLGKLKDDKKFLEDLLANPKFTRKGYGKNIATQKSAADAANEALQFLSKRADFWQKQKPILIFE